MSDNTVVYRPSTFNEVQSLLKNNQHIKVMAGGTEFLYKQADLAFVLPKYILSLTGVKELFDIAKTERYMDFGSMVPLGQILQLGEKNIEPILYDSIKTIASTNLRFVASLGGNLAVTNMQKTLMPIIMLLDSRIELRTGTEVFWLPYSKYVGNESLELRQKPHVITRLRVYSENWNYSFFRRLGRKGVVDAETAYFIFLLKYQKNIITDVRICFSSSTILRSKEFENSILGEMLPLSSKDISVILQNSQKYFTDENITHKFHKLIFFNLLEKCLLELS